jgi:hypothetical protein
MIMHHNALYTPCIALLIVIIFYICDGLRGAEDRNSSAASPIGVRRSTSVKL